MFNNNNEFYYYSPSLNQLWLEWEKFFIEKVIAKEIKKLE